MNALVRGIKTIQQIGLLPVLQVALYRFGLISGHYRRLTPPGGKSTDHERLVWLTPAQALNKSILPHHFEQYPQLAEECREEAGLILAGKCHIFGNQLADILRDDFDATRHWTEYELGRVPLPEKDVKFLWEPARLGWIFALGRAKAAGYGPSSGRQSWQLLEKFLAQNPVNCGPNWMNGQEVALRILAMVFFHETFRDEIDMPGNWEQVLALAVIEHARRIPPTLVYARSQQNNHLLVEAAGLYTAGIFLPDHPEAGGWKKSGWILFHQALDEQIQDDGTYAQYSTNYHRLMLQTSLWMRAVGLRVGDEFPERSSQKLAAGTQWLAGLMAKETGQVPNYGHNDGAYIIPLTGQPFNDFRPVVQSAQHFFQSGSVAAISDEMSLWFEWLAGKKIDCMPDNGPIPKVQSYRKLVDGDVTAIIFAPQFNRRPGQADLLHTELWRKGEPLLLDAGTYQYNADPPWQNALAQTKVHNTLTINGENQMIKAGRFLWLDWPKVAWTDNRMSPDQIAASHDGFRRYGVLHEREVQTCGRQQWKVVDSLTPANQTEKQVVNICLNWLLPSLNWRIAPDGFVSGSDLLKIRIPYTIDADNKYIVPEYQIIKAGEIISASPGWSVPTDEITNLGWYSPSYGTKEQAISYRVRYRGRVPITILTEFQVC